MNTKKGKGFTAITFTNNLIGILITVIVLLFWQPVRLQAFSLTAEHPDELSQPSEPSQQKKDSRGKKDKEKYNVYQNIPYKTIPQNQLITRSLFMQTQRANIELPQRGGVSGAAGEAVIGEDVSYTNADYHSKYFDNKDIKADKVYELSEVEVTAKSVFSPEHNGQINVDFLITVPKALVSPQWRLTLTPKLADGDTIIELPPLIVKGEQFMRKQIDDYRDFEKYMNSIVDTSKYAEVFLDKSAVRQDIQARQQFYYDKYYREWERQLAYEKWRVEHENSNEKFMAREIGKMNALYHKYARQANEESIRALSLGMDTIGIHEKYMAIYRKETADLQKKWEQATAVKGMPSEFLDVHESGKTLADIYNDVMTDKDSVKIASHLYKYELIAENELKAIRLQDRKKEIIQFEFENNFKDTINVSSGENLVYLYKYSYPTRIGMKSVSVSMTGKIDAVDLSSYISAKSDSIKYIVASLAQLVDMSLIKEEKLLNRDLYNKMSLAFDFAGTNEFSLARGSNRARVNEFIEAYRTFVNAGLVVDSVELAMYTSLAGTWDANYERSMKRAQAIVDFFAREYGSEMNANELFKIQRKRGGEDWTTLANLINSASASEVKHKAEIIELISTAKDPDATEANIKKKYPTDYRYISQHIYPKLSRGEFGLNMTRPGMTEATEVKVEEKPGYEQAVELLLERDYWKALEILADYPDYNTALALACVGYNAKAMDLLESLKPNGYTEYLSAVLKIRMGKEEEAVAHLEKACELDPSKIYRASLDPEISALVRKFNLNLNALDTPIDESYDTSTESDVDATEDTNADDVDATEDANAAIE